MGVREEVLSAAISAGVPGAADQRRSAGPRRVYYLGQFIDHDLTLDRTSVALGKKVSVDELLQDRSPALDLDSLYGRGLNHPEDSAILQ